jgi:dienelactone hydrolase
MGLGRRGALLLLLLLLLLCMSSPALASNSTCVLTTGADCVGHDLSNAKALTPQKCCDLCGATPGCLAFTHSLYDADGKPDPTCYLKSECSRTQPASTCTAGVAAAPTPAPAPTPPTPPPAPTPAPAPPSKTYKVEKSQYDVSGYGCGDKSKTTLVFYPSDGALGQRFHPIVYGHGIGGGDDGCDDWLRTVASLGLVVIAPATSGGACPLESLDMLLALKASREGSMGGLAHLVDWARTGVMGHSMGGMAAPTAASAPGYNITALLASHGALFAADVPVPAMFTTGTADTTVDPATVRAAFDACPSRPKVFANLVGGVHMEPRDGSKHLNLFDAQFLACHVANRTDSCDAIYGGGKDSLCRKYSYAACVIKTT